jgi:cell division topological specificity factor
MSLLDWIRRPSSAPVARDRLKILLAHERTFAGQPDLLAVLHEEILEVISRHVTVAPDKVQVKVDRGPAVSTLAIDIEIPTANGKLAVAVHQTAAGKQDQWQQKPLAPRPLPSR